MEIRFLFIEAGGSLRELINLRWCVVNATTKEMSLISLGSDCIENCNCTEDKVYEDVVKMIKGKLKDDEGLSPHSKMNLKGA